MSAKQIEFTFNNIKVGSIVITPDHGQGKVEQIWKPGEWQFDLTMFNDDGSKPTEPVIAVRTAQHRWRWYFMSEIRQGQACDVSG
jgi:hypothetical protein